jgi:hypothetical protein
MKAIAALLSLLLASSAETQSAKEKYELSAQCEKRAAERFEREWGNGVFNHADGRQTISKYEHHYSTRLNKCFYLEIRDTFQSGKAPLRMMNLVDLHENRTTGRYSKIAGDKFGVCLVQDKQCKTEEEWSELIKPFMED